MKRKLLVIIISVVVLSAVCAGTVLALYSAIALAGGVRLTVARDKQYQTIRGFGASSAWWYQLMGAYQGDEADAFRQRAIDLVYGDEGLSLNTFRYNIGAGSCELYRGGVGDYRTYNNGQGRRQDALTESFFLSQNFAGDYAAFSDLCNYSLQQDSATQTMFRLALATGNVQRVVAFCNSPHYLLTQSGFCLGQDDYQNNLRADCFEAFADYAILCTYTLYRDIIRRYGILSDAVYISPVNEPQHRWSLASADQEGCHYDPAYLADFYQVFYRRLLYWNSVWHTDFVMDIFESGDYKQNSRLSIWQYVQAFEQKEFWSYIDHLSLHSYNTEDNNAVRRAFRRKLQAKGYDDAFAISMSEYCDMVEGRDCSMAMALKDSRIINGDLTILNAADWSWWLSVSSENYNSTLVYYDVVDNGLDKRQYVITLPKRYYAVKHYSAFVQAGDVRVDVRSSDPWRFAGLDVCAFLQPNGAVVMIVTNTGRAQNVHLSGLPRGPVTTYTTTEDTDWAIRTYDDVDSLRLPAYSITTIVFG